MLSEPRIGSLCTGYGGLDIAAQAVFGGSLAWWSDIEPGPIKVMEHHHPDVPNIGDLKTAAWHDVPEVDILTAGYPCQPFSNAGKRLGTEDPRHLWPWIADAIGVLRPRIVLLENVAAHLRRGFDVVSADLAGLGYRVAWGIVSAAEVGAPHLRKRLYVVATDTARELGYRSGDIGTQRWPEHSNGSSVTADAAGERWAEGRPESARLRGGSDVAYGGGDAAVNASSPRLEIGTVEPAGPELEAAERGGDHETREQDWLQYADAVRRWERILGVPAPMPTVIGARGGRVLSPYLPEWMMGVPGRITSVPGLTRNEQIKLAGNGVVPQQAEYAIRELYSQLFDRKAA